MTFLYPDFSHHDDVIKWKHFPRNWPFVRGIHRTAVNSPHKGQWRGALMFFFDLHLNKRLSKQSWGWWFETLSGPLWRHCNVAPGRCSCNIAFAVSNVHQRYISRHFMWNCSHVNAIRPHWRLVYITLGNGLVPLGNKTLSEPVLINVYHNTIWCH